MEAAALASQKSGLLIEMHTQKGANAEDFVTYFSNLGLPADRLVLCHIDKRPDTGLHQELAAEGYLLEYDTFFRSKYKPESHLWPLLRMMVASGFSKSVALATDLADSSQWKSFGGRPGLAGFPIQIRKRIQQEFNNDSLTERLMGGNIADRLAVAI
jgi:phosphotriesterase-related protein